MAGSKKLDGKTYYYRGKFSTKTAAKKRAKLDRSRGGKARIIKSGKFYYIYGHK